MKVIKSFFFFIGVAACGLFILYFRLFSNNPTGVGHTVKVVNMNVFSEKIRDILRKSPKTVEEIVNKIASLNGDGNGIKHGETNVNVHSKETGKTDTYTIGGSKSKTIDEPKSTSIIKTTDDTLKSKDTDEEKTKETDVLKKDDAKVPADNENKDKIDKSLPMCSEKGSKLGRFWNKRNTFIREIEMKINLFKKSS